MATSLSLEQNKRWAMTLIIGAVNRRHAVLVSDRRLSFDGQILEDESNKAATLVCRDARLAIAFTGLARFGSFSTRQWLLEALSEAAEPDCKVGPMLDRLAKLATTTFARFSIPSRFLTVFCAGYIYDDAGPRGLMALVSNFESWERPPFTKLATEFTVSWIREKRPSEETIAVVRAVGMESVVRDEDFDAIHTLLKNDKPARAAVGKAVEVIRAAADRPASRNTIGRQCTSIVLPSDPGSEVLSEYHSAVRSYVRHGVSHVEARGGPHGIFMIDGHESGFSVNDAPQVVAGPKLGRNQPCWCGSGEKFKRCHGRTT